MRVESVTEPDAPAERQPLARGVGDGVAEARAAQELGGREGLPVVQHDPLARLPHRDEAPLGHLPARPHEPEPRPQAHGLRLVRPGRTLPSVLQQHRPLRSEPPVLPVVDGHPMGVGDDQAGVRHPAHGELLRRPAAAPARPRRPSNTAGSGRSYLDDYPNAPEPVSETPLPHTTLNPAAAFETADEGYDGVPFPRPPREFTRPSFLPDSDDGGTDPGQALRNDGLDPPRPPTLGGRLRESGIQAAETVIAGAAAGAAAATRSVSENQILDLEEEALCGLVGLQAHGDANGPRGRRSRTGSTAPSAIRSSRSGGSPPCPRSGRYFPPLELVWMLPSCIAMADCALMLPVFFRRPFKMMFAERADSPVTFGEFLCATLLLAGVVAAIWLAARPWEEPEDPRLRGSYIIK